MKLKKFKSFKTVRLGEGNWMYHLAYLDDEGVTVSFSKEGFVSKDEAQGQGAAKRAEANKYIPTIGVTG